MSDKSVSFEEADVPEKAWSRESKYAHYEAPAASAVANLAKGWDEDDNRSSKSRRAILPTKQDGDAMKAFLQSAANELDPKRTARVRLTPVEGGNGAQELVTWLVPFTSRGPGAKEANAKIADAKSPKK